MLLPQDPVWNLGYSLRDADSHWTTDMNKGRTVSNIFRQQNIVIFHKDKHSKHKHQPSCHDIQKHKMTTVNNGRTYSYAQTVANPTTSSAVIERPRDAPCCWKFRYVTEDHSVIWNCTVEYGMCKFLLVVHCNYQYVYAVPFLRHSTSNNSMLLRSGHGALPAVIENGTIRQMVYAFLFSRSVWV